MDDRAYKGKLSVPLGPVAFAFDGVMKVEEVNPDNQTARVTARGRRRQGKWCCQCHRLLPD